MSELLFIKVDHCQSTEDQGGGSPDCLLCRTCERSSVPIPGRTIALLFKTMARCASSMHTLQNYQSGRIYSSLDLKEGQLAKRVPKMG